MLWPCKVLLNFFPQCLWERFWLVGKISHKVKGGIYAKGKLGTFKVKFPTPSIHELFSIDIGEYVRIYMLLIFDLYGNHWLLVVIFKRFVMPISLPQLIILLEKLVLTWFNAFSSSHVIFSYFTFHFLIHIFGIVLYLINQFRKKWIPCTLEKLFPLRNG